MELKVAATDTILMVRPIDFGFNTETAASNAYQVKDDSKSAAQINSEAILEFDNMVAVLRAAGINIIVVQDTAEPKTPDSIFPNNWVSFHEDGRVFTFPMEAKNRRLERRRDILEMLKYEEGMQLDSIVDLSIHELEGKYLEGTGSIVWDRANKTAYACLSTRTNADLLQKHLDYFEGAKSVIFHAKDEKGKDIYHTNVVMCIGNGFCVVCMDAIPTDEERTKVRKALENDGFEIVDISFDQMNRFAGNMLQVKNTDNQPVLVMSSQAYNALDESQISRLQTYTSIVHAPIDTIETAGGGSARCMMAEVFLPRIG